MDDKWYDDSREKTRSYRNTCISSMEKENDEHLNTLLNNRATWTGKNKTRLVNFSNKWHKKCVQGLKKTGLS